MIRNNLLIKQRIESHIISRENCWITNHKIDVNGRPRISVDGKSYILARVVYKLYKGDFPNNLFVCHTCDNPLCINPEHLYIGDNAEKGHNTKKRNRQAKGSTIGSAKLNETQVLKVKQLLVEGKLSLRQIGQMFGVSATTISLINNGKSWTHVEGIGATIDESRSGKSFKLNEGKVKQIKKLIAEGMSLTRIGNLFGVSVSTISEIKHNKAWIHVTLDENN
jgi:transposase